MPPWFILAELLTCDDSCIESLKHACGSTAHISFAALSPWQVPIFMACTLVLACFCLFLAFYQRRRLST